MNKLTVRAGGMEEQTAQGSDGQPVELTYIIDNGEGEGQGVKLFVRATPTLSAGVQQWLVRTENNGDPTMNIDVSYEFSSPIIATGQTLALVSQRGDVERRMTFVGGTPFKNRQATPDENDDVFVDKARFALGTGGAMEFGASATVA